MPDVNDLIANGIRPPQVEDLNSAREKLLAIRAEQQRLAINDQALKGGDLKLLQERQAYEDEQKYRAIIAKNAAPPAVPAGSNAQQAPPQAPPQAAPQQAAPQQPAPPQAGPVPQGPPPPTAPGTNVPLHAFDVNQAIIDLRQAGLGAHAEKLASTAVDQGFKVAETRKNNAAAEKDETETTEKRNSIVFNGVSYLRGLPNAQARAAAYPQVAQHLHDEGHIDKSKLPDQYPGDQWLENEYGVAGTQVQKDQVEKAKRDAALFPSQQMEAQQKAEQARLQTQQAQRIATAQQLASAFQQGGSAGLNQTMNQMPHGLVQDFVGAKDDKEIMRRALTPEQSVTADQAKATANEVNRHNLSTEATARLNASVASGRLAQERMVNGLKYGPGTQEYWVEQLKANPDSITEMPAELRSSVGQKFKEATGLPLPKAIAGPTQASETAARNAIDGIKFLQEALKNPEIASNLGPIMGRLGETNEKIGTSLGLSPEAAELAQEVRTRMRYFVFQEGKAVLGGRLPQQLMRALEDSSANVRMDPPMLNGALKGAENNANSVMDNADRQRFGGAMRPREMRQKAEQAGQPATQQQPAAKSGVVKVTDPRGVEHTFPTQQQADAFKKAARIQ